MHLQSGIDWNYDDEDDDPDAPVHSELWPEQQWKDSDFRSILNDLQSAKLCPDRKDREYFLQTALLKIQIMQGVKGANKILDRVIATGAATAEALLRRFEGGNN
ncbi:hypothetical protein Paes_2376 (plasmid) [Prosthecochloris aestuarii DSM 271]|uniref:Uncharacterized protein n=1 Tax=Prosthecochloris aestuarii (strain DSM 271 / SK 413) TaxID=290512 RepID=B4S9P0_PROA2|nr:hypothetical protein [Prosthecochloris aestuarii]ACF47367.1 hypothetical protein Paes_2376 [Prosthecochloris aestuarii DSM 271]